MTAVHLVLRYAHISMGMLGIASGAAAMSFPKGSRLHRQSGNVFFVSMLIMSAVGAYLAAFVAPSVGNVMGGTMTFYLVGTAWATVIRKPGETGRFEIAAALAGLAIAIAGISFGLDAPNHPKGLKDGYPALLYFIWASVALLAAVLDVRVIARGGVTGVARTTRHLWRMCLAMFVATASFFLGQAKVFPAAARESGLLPVPVLVVIGAFLYFLIRVRVLPWLQRLRAPRLMGETT